MEAHAHRWPDGWVKGWGLGAVPAVEPLGLTPLGAFGTAYVRRLTSAGPYTQTRYLAQVELLEQWISSATGQQPMVTMGFGDFHSVTLLTSFATASVVRAAAMGAGTVHSRPGRIATGVVGAASLASAALVLDGRLDTGPFGAIVIVAFLGVPVWVAVQSVRLLRGRLGGKQPTGVPNIQQPALAPAAAAAGLPT